MATQFAAPAPDDRGDEGRNSSKATGELINKLGPVVPPDLEGVDLFCSPEGLVAKYDCGAGIEASVTVNRDDVSVKLSHAKDQMPLSFGPLQDPSWALSKLLSRMIATGELHSVRREIDNRLPDEVRAQLLEGCEESLTAVLMQDHRAELGPKIAQLMRQRARLMRHQELVEEYRAVATPTGDRSRERDLMRVDLAEFAYGVTPSQVLGRLLSIQNPYRISDNFCERARNLGYSLDAETKPISIHGHSSHPDRGKRFVNPAQFIVAAEAHGFTPIEIAWLAQKAAGSENKGFYRRVDELMGFRSVHLEQQRFPVPALMAVTAGNAAVQYQAKFAGGEQLLAEERSGEGILVDFSALPGVQKFDPDSLHLEGYLNRLIVNHLADPNVRLNPWSVNVDEFRTTVPTAEIVLTIDRFLAGHSQIFPPELASRLSNLAAKLHDQSSANPQQSARSLLMEAYSEPYSLRGEDLVALKLILSGTGYEGFETQLHMFSEKGLDRAVRERFKKQYIGKL